MDPMPSEPLSSKPLPTEPGGSERRLHAWSWLFVLLTNLRHVALPAIVLLVFGRGETWELLGGIAALGLALYSLVYSFGFRYRVGTDELVIREGIFDRTERHIPFTRIQNVAQRRNPLHRLFGVTELRLESAGGVEPEAKMSVITLAEAAALEQLLRRGGRPAGSAEHAGIGEHSDAVSPPEVLLRLPLGELVRLGIVSNRGMVVVAALIGGLFQSGNDPRDIPLLRSLWGSMEGILGEWIQGHGALELLASGTIFVVLAIGALRVLSIVLAIVRHWNFALERDGSRIGTEEGLLTRVRAGASAAKIQRITVEESLLQRLLGRRALRVDVAGSLAAMNEASGTRLKWLAPIATPAQIDGLIATLAPQLAISRDDWRSLHPRAWRRLAAVPGAMLLLLAAMALLALAVSQGQADAIRFLPIAGGVWLALSVLVLLRARGWARFSAYAIDDQVLAYRSGWLTRDWRVLELSRMQGAVLHCSPLDRRNRMANIAIEVAGTGARGYSIDIPFLDRAEAEALLQRLIRHAADAPAGAHVGAASV
jgi:putative membrane protein